MVFAASLWLLAAACELFLYKWLPSDKVRLWFGAGVIALLLVSGGALVALHPVVWLPAWVVGCYRVINILRVMQYRLPHAELQRISIRAYSWLLTAQAVVTAVAWLVHTHRNMAWYGFDILVALQVLSVLVVLRVSVNTWRHTRPNDVTTSLPDKELPSVSVLVPARNETDALEQCLAALVASNYPKLEIVVLDDCSANRRTPDIIRSFAQSGVRFVQGDAPDESRWLAKNQAYDRLAQEANGEILIFCGVDVQFAPNTVRSLVELLLRKDKDMMSVLPMRAQSVWAEASLLQPMRYFWEICLPRRFFKRPPVLSTCWLITAEALIRAGGFEAVSRSITPEAHFARQAVIGDRYSFIRADAALGVVSTKPVHEQYDTTVRTRYPQLHRRLELVAVTTLLELALLLGPLIGLLTLWRFPHKVLLGSIWLVLVLVLEAVYYLVAVRTKLNSPFLSWLLFPAAAVVDIGMLHVSMWKYEFGTVNWKGRNVCIPVMRVEPRLPKI